MTGASTDLSRNRDQIIHFFRGLHVRKRGEQSEFHLPLCQIVHQLIIGRREDYLDRDREDLLQIRHQGLCRAKRDRRSQSRDNSESKGNPDPEASPGEGGESAHPVQIQRRFEPPASELSRRQFDAPERGQNKG